MASSAAASSGNAAALPSPNFRFSCFFPNIFVYAASRLPCNLPFQRNSRFGSLAVCFSRRQKHGFAIPTRQASSEEEEVCRAVLEFSDVNNLHFLFLQQFSPENHGSEEDELDEDAFKALFKQLEEDLKNDDSSFDDIEDDISEEELAKLEGELAEALGDDELQMSISSTKATGHDDDDAEADDDSADDEDIEDGISEEDLARLERELAEALGDDDDAKAGDDNDDDDDDDNDNVDEDDDIERPAELKRWQLRRLAAALKNSRRKTIIKNLAAELCLERTVVLKLLRDPPPNLLMMSAMLPDEAPEPKMVPENRTAEVATPWAVPEAIEYNTPPKVKAPLHVMLRTWSSQKRLKKAQVVTLERVYKRTKRPTNAMICSIVHVTSLPRKKIIKWFEDKRAEDGVPDRRLPYERPVPDTVG